VILALTPLDWRPEALRVIQLVLIGFFGLCYWSARKLLAQEGRDALRALWWITVCYFAVVQPFYMGWYIIWPTVMAAGLVERRITGFTTLLAVGGFLIYLEQFVVVPLAGASFGWLARNLVALLVGFGPFLIGWAISRQGSAVGFPGLQRFSPARTTADP